MRTVKQRKKLLVEGFLSFKTVTSSLLDVNNILLRNITPSTANKCIDNYISIVKILISFLKSELERLGGDDLELTSYVLNPKKTIFFVVESGQLNIVKRSEEINLVKYTPGDKTRSQEVANFFINNIEEVRISISYLEDLFGKKIDKILAEISQ